MPIPLVERSKEEIAQIVRRKVEGTKGVKSVGPLNIRAIGKRYDISISVSLESNLALEDAHKISMTIEKEVRRVVPNARVAVNTEPFGNGQENVWKLVKDIAEGTPGSRGVHNIHIQKIEGKLCIDLHLEVSANMTVKQAHHVADQVEKKIRAANHDISDVTVHIESASDRVSREMGGFETELESYIEHVAERFSEIKSVSGIRVSRFGDAIHVVLQCRFDPKLNIQRAHEISNQLESAIKSANPTVTRIDVHEEPA